MIPGPLKGILELAAAALGPAHAAILDEEVSKLDKRMEELEAVATGQVLHIWNGSCPDAIEGYNVRDPGCPACRALGNTTPNVAYMTDEEGRQNAQARARAYFSRIVELEGDLTRSQARVAELENEVNLLHRQRHAAQEDAANARLLAAVRPHSPDVVPVPREEWEDAKREISAWRDATKANERTKALHIGEYHLSLNVVDDDGEECPWNVPVTWTAIKEIMEAIRADKNKLCALRSGEAGK